MRRAWLAVALLVIGTSAARADYLFMQYIMGFKRNQPQGSGPGPSPGGPPAAPAPGGQPNPNEPNRDVIQIPVNAVVEVSEFKQLANPLTQRVKVTVKTKWGTTSLYNDDELTTRRVPLPTVKKRYTDKLETLNKNRTN